MARFQIPLIVVSCAAIALCACKPQGSATSSGGADQNSYATDDSTDTDHWVENGATACNKYLTPDVVGAIFQKPSGQSHKIDSQNCEFETAHPPNTDFSTIHIYLWTDGGVAYSSNPTTINGTPIQGIGDKAVRTQEDGVQALKGNHICTIFVKPPILKGDAIAQELGTVCNKLFALP